MGEEALMRVLLTGAGGFIGSHVARLLIARGEDVTAVLRPDGRRDRIADVVTDLSIVEADLNSTDLRKLVVGAKPDLCIHLAWYVEPTRYLTAVQENLTSLATGARLLAALDGARCPRAVIAGTCLEPGTLIAGQTRGPETIYAAAKNALHQVGMRLGHTDVACAHIFHLYGPGENRRRVVPSVIRSCLQGRAIDVTSGIQRRDFMHVEDVASGIISLANSDVQGSVDICSGVSTSLRQVFEAIGEETGRPELIGIGNRPHAPGEPREIAGDGSALLRTGWQPGRTLRGGIADAVAWWRAHLDLERNER